MVNCSCLYCHKSFQARGRPYPSGNRFCSEVCYRAYRRSEGGIRHCEVCGNPKWFAPHKLARQSHYHCSRECWLNRRWGGPRTLEVECAYCGKKLIKQRWQVERRTGRCFCNQKCMGGYRSTVLVGPNSPIWRGGKTHDYARSNWKSVRKKIRERDKHTCRYCGRKWKKGERLFDVHHIRPYESFDDKSLANSEENLVTACRPCHSRFHPGYTGKKPELLPMQTTFW